MKRKHSVYSAEFKTHAISMVKDGKRPASEVVRDLEIKVNTLYTWLASTTGTATKTTDDSELKQLKKELAQAELERDILKKSAAYFTNNYLFYFKCGLTIWVNQNRNIMVPSI